MDSDFECLIVGGGAAGLAAAITLGRARRKTLLVDSGGQSNLAAEGIGGLLGYDRRPPAELYAAGRHELADYPSVTVRDGLVSGVANIDSGSTSALDMASRAPVSGFSVTLAGGTEVSSARVLLAGGMEYRYEDVPGLAERWGGTAFHCPFCHGWEVRGRPLAVLSPGPVGVHQALLLRAWSDDVTLMCGPAEIAGEDHDRLTAAGITVEQRAAVALHGPGRALESIELADGASLPCGGVLVASTLHQRDSLAAGLGVEFAEPNPMTTEAIAIDATHLTSVAGVYAAGDVCPGPPSVSRALAAGHFAAAMIVASLVI